MHAAENGWTQTNPVFVRVPTFLKYSKRSIIAHIWCRTIFHEEVLQLILSIQQDIYLSLSTSCTANQMVLPELKLVKI